MFEQSPYPVRENIAESHQHAWQLIGSPGAFWRANERVAMVREARAALVCGICAARKNSLTPFGGPDHGTTEDLPAIIVDLVHRIVTDPQRMTRRVFDEVIAAGYSLEQYLEVVAVTASSVVIDTTNLGAGIAPLELPEPLPGEPTGQEPPDLVDDGAWVPITRVDRTTGPTGLPSVPNIARSLGAVPSARDLFFAAFRGHYALRDIPLAVTQAQAEFIASRVSAMNECFY